jgi:hypothetical protein
LANEREPMKTKQYLSSLFLLLSLGACNQFLEVAPKESVSDEAPITDKASAETALRGAYNGLANENYYGTSFPSIGYLSGDNVQWTGSQSQVQEFINHKVNADNATVGSAWVAIYRTINRANNVIVRVATVKDATFTQDYKNQLIGEAYFIRALAYFDLARTWGGVPLITQPTLTPNDNVGVQRSSQAETYAQVLNDLEAAEPLLPATTDRFRATRKTVWGLKARFYLYQQNWAKAEEYATKLISDATNYQLVKPFNAFFANNVRGTQESVFEIFYNGTTEVNTHRNQWQPQTNGGTRQWAPNDAFVALVNNVEIGGSRNALVAKDNQNRWYGNLYYRSPASDPSYVIRTAEIYLIRAEARAQLDNPAEAAKDLNAVRDRAGLVATTAVTKEEILLAIENERRVEFAFEPHRWFDLVRTGRADEVLNVTDPKRYILPIPVQQLLVDKTLKQNDGY